MNQSSAEINREERTLETFISEAERSNEAVAVNEYIFQSKDMGDAYMVITNAGNVVINTGLPGYGEVHKRRFQAVSQNPLSYIILTQSHANQFGGAQSMRDDCTQIIAQQSFPTCRTYWRDLHDFYARRSGKLWARALGRRSKQNELVEPTVDIFFNEFFHFTLGNLRFELLSTPGGESQDSLVVWLPKEKVLFTGNLFGPIFGHIPNLYTIRGDKIRSAQEFLNSLRRVKELRPQLILTGHGSPIRGEKLIMKTLDQLERAVGYIYSETIQGMNQGRSVYDLMRSITLPNELQVGEGHGKVSWCVRAIWEYYSGWFHFDSTAALYPSEPTSIAPDVVKLAGGERIIDQAKSHMSRKEPLLAVRLIELVIAVEPNNISAWEVMLASHELLLANCGDNFSESAWLESEIDRAKTQLALLSGQGIKTS